MQSLIIEYDDIKELNDLGNIYCRTHDALTMKPNYWASLMYSAIGAALVRNHYKAVRPLKYRFAVDLGILIAGYLGNSAIAQYNLNNKSNTLQHHDFLQSVSFHVAQDLIKNSTTEAISHSQGLIEKEIKSVVTGVVQQAFKNLSSGKTTKVEFYKDPKSCMMRASLYPFNPELQSIDVNLELIDELKNLAFVYASAGHEAIHILNNHITLRFYSHILQIVIKPLAYISVLGLSIDQSPNVSTIFKNLGIYGALIFGITMSCNLATSINNRYQEIEADLTSANELGTHKELAQYLTEILRYGDSSSIFRLHPSTQSRIDLINEAGSRFPKQCTFFQTPAFHQMQKTMDDLQATTSVIKKLS